MQGPAHSRHPAPTHPSQGRDRPRDWLTGPPRNLFDPRVAGGKPTEFCFALLNQPFKRLVQAQILLDSEFFGKRQFQSQPPFPLVDRKRREWWLALELPLAEKLRVQQEIGRAHV